MARWTKQQSDTGDAVVKVYEATEGEATYQIAVTPNAAPGLLNVVWTKIRKRGPDPSEYFLLSVEEVKEIFYIDYNA